MEGQPLSRRQRKGFYRLGAEVKFCFIGTGCSSQQPEGKYDLVHAHDWLVTYAARGLKHIYNMPLLATIHATEFEGITGFIPASSGISAI